MPACNDPTCPLNRQGVPHLTHAEIEQEELVDRCNDPRCAMNRMGIPHNTHGDIASNGAVGTVDSQDERVSYESAAGRIDAPYQFESVPAEPADNADATDALNELLRNVRGEARQERQERRAEPRPRPEVRAAPAPAFNDAYELFGVARDATCAEIKSRYRELVRAHDSSRGRIHRSEDDRRGADLMMSRINRAYSDLRAARGCG